MFGVVRRGVGARCLGFGLKGGSECRTFRQKVTKIKKILDEAKDLLDPGQSLSL